MKKHHYAQRLVHSLVLPTIEATSTFTRETRMEMLKLRFSNGAERDFHRIAPGSNAAVMVIAMPNPETVLLTREYGCGFHRYEIGLPRGRIDDGENAIEAAQRELQEEAGFGAHRLDLLRTLALAPSYMTQEIHVVLARDLFVSKLAGDEPEAIEVIEWPLADIETLALEPAFSEGRALAALLVARAWLAHDAKSTA
jgi:ADP-ribose diphosphatase